MQIRFFKNCLGTNELLFLFCFVSICIRFLFVGYGFPEESFLKHSDQSTYLQLSKILSENFSYNKDFGFGRLPIYPLFISVVLKISEKLYFLIFVQHLLGILGILVIFRIGKLFSLEIGLLSALFASINLNLINSSNFVLTESIFVLIFLLFIFFYMKFLKNAQSNYLVVSSVFLGLCSLIRPVVIYLPVIIIIFTLFLKINFLSKIRLSLLFLIFYLITVSPWLSRNYYYHGFFSFSSQETPTIIGWYLPHIDQFEKNIDLQTARELRKNHWREKFENLPNEIKENPFRLEQKVKYYAFKEILESNKISVLQAWFWGSLKNIFSPFSADFAYFYKIPHSSFYETSGSNVLKQTSNFLFKNSNIFYSFFIILTLVTTLVFRTFQLHGFFCMAKHYKTEFIFFLTIILYFLIINGPIGSAKYRAPFEPILIIYLAFSIATFKNYLVKND